MSSDTPSGPLVVPVSAAERTERYGVGVAAQYDEGVPVSSNAAGTVTRLLVAPGDVLDTGTVVLMVDDTPIVAYVSDAPLWRDLDVGAEGEDVARLQSVLSGLGLYKGRADGEFGTTTARAVRSFNKSYGREDQGTRFATSSVVWVGPSPVRVASLEVAVGATVSAGSVVALGPRRAASLVVTEPTGGIAVGGEFQLTVNGIATPYVPGSGVVTAPDAVTAITASLGTTGEGAGQVTSSAGEPVLRVPASAIVVDPSGASCVFESAAGEPIAVTVLGGTLASADLATGITATHVLANPLSVLEDPPCGSSPQA